MTKTDLDINPSKIRYIKLGDGGRWAEQSLQDGVISFGYHTVSHEACQNKDWAAVRKVLVGRKSEGARTAGVNEVRTFYEAGEDWLWITFADGYLYWAFAYPDVSFFEKGPGEGPSRTRKTIGGWRRTDFRGRDLKILSLSSKLTQVANFRATICKVAESEYLTRRVKGIEEPLVMQARDARGRMIEIACKMIKSLHWSDFETLTDLIFARSGWQRSTKVGGDIADLDLLMEQPTTGETAFVQIKSRADQTVLNDYLARFHRSNYDRFFFICHSAKGRLQIPSERRLHLFEGERLADAAVKNGLYDWLIERTG